jgi:hypothetical protein
MRRHHHTFVALEQKMLGFIIVLKNETSIFSKFFNNPITSSTTRRFWPVLQRPLSPPRVVARVRARASAPSTLAGACRCHQRLESAADLERAVPAAASKLARASQTTTRRRRAAPMLSSACAPSCPRPASALARVGASPRLPRRAVRRAPQTSQPALAGRALSATPLLPARWLRCDSSWRCQRPLGRSRAP